MHLEWNIVWSHCSVQRKSQVRNIIPYLYEICRTVKKGLFIYLNVCLNLCLSVALYSLLYAHLNPYPFLINIRVYYDSVESAFNFNLQSIVSEFDYVVKCQLKKICTTRNIYEVVSY